MKKTLIAMAAIAATGAFAQSSVTISGNMDLACASNTGSVALQQGTTCSTTVGTSSTSVLRFIATEDLGGGLKVTAQYNFDPRTITNDSTGVTGVSKTTSLVAGTAQIGTTVTGLARDEAFVGLSGGFGSVKLGAANSPSLDVNGASSPLGTGIGSGYSLNGGSATNWSSATNTRLSRSVKYETPTIGGFSLAVQYAPGNDQTGTTTGALLIPNARTVTDVGIKYSAGKLNLAYANVAQTAQTNPVGFIPGAASALSSTSVNAYAANYTFGAVTLYLGGYNGNNLAAANVTAGRGGIKATMGAIDLMAQYTEVNTAGVIQKTTGARFDYNLSKTAAVYAGLEQYDSGASTTQNLTAVGLRKSF